MTPQPQETAKGCRGSCFSAGADFPHAQLRQRDFPAHSSAPTPSCPTCPLLAPVSAVFSLQRGDSDHAEHRHRPLSLLQLFLVDLIEQLVKTTQEVF